MIYFLQNTAQKELILSDKAIGLLFFLQIWVSKWPINDHF